MPRQHSTITFLSDYGRTDEVVGVGHSVIRCIAPEVDLYGPGEPVDPITLVPGLLPVSREEDGELIAEVLWVDRFGNAQLNIDPDEIAGWGERVRVRTGERTRVATLAATYAALK